MSIAPSPIKRATVVGDGAMGTVCGLILAGRGVDVRIWSPFPNQIADLQRDRENRRFLAGHSFPDALTATADAAEAFCDTELIVSAVPCQFVRQVWSDLVAAFPPGKPVVSVTKGIENGTLLRATQIIGDVLGEVPLAVLSGPSIATEVADGLPCTVVSASDDLTLAGLIQQSFSTRSFRVYTNADLLGVELAGATKNVVALAAGIIDGLKAGDNAKAALITRGLVEITRLGVAMGAHAETFKGLAGVGDLVTTCVSPVGRNRSAGERIGAGESAADVVAATPSVIEGIPTTRSVVELAREYHVQMPITSAVYEVLFEHMSPRSAIDELMTRQLKHE